jgi:hypothetical protein
MADHERDELEGRINRELREADAALKQLLGKAEQHAQQIAELANLFTARVQRAREVMKGSVVEVPEHGRWREVAPHDAGIESGQLKQYEKAVDLEAIDTLDREIGVAVARFEKARQAKAQLGV